MYPYWYPMYGHDAYKNKAQDECEAEIVKKCNCPEVGDVAPDFKLEGVMLGKKVEVCLSDYRGKWVLLLFYPGDFTFVWPTELAAVAAANGRLKKLNTEVLAISTDSIYSHKIFMEISPSARTVNFPLLSDRNHEVGRRYCSLNEKTGSCYRVVYIINPEGIVESILIYPNHVGKSSTELLRMIEALEFSRETGLATPADWVPGMPGIERKWENVGKI